ncbi:MAG: LysM repeat protein [Planctomycetota bacterium]|jgi:LysM repeat protein
MRQFVLGLIAAALAWWGYDKWIANQAHAGGPTNTTSGQPADKGQATGVAGLEGAGLTDVLNGNASPRSDSPRSDLPRSASGEVLPLDSGGDSTGGVPLAADVDELLPLVDTGNADAISLAWQAVASGNLGDEHDRVLASLAPRGDDFSKQLAALGNHNAFLHSVEGRAASARALKTAMALPDHEAVKAGSQLLYLMARGRILRSDTVVRDAVDKAYRQHLIRVDRWMCNPTNVAGARSYTVKPGNSLDVIARHFRRQGIKVEAGTIAVLNRISNPNLLRAGQKLKIPVAPVSAVLEKRSYALMLFVGDELLRLYWVGHGENDRTPVTTFTVIAKQAKPDWTAPDGNVYAYGRKENILGEYFIKFGHDQYSGFGAHGTPMPNTICTQSSMGCLRMFDQDIAELFQILPRGANVVVQSTESVR